MKAWLYTLLRREGEAESWFTLKEIFCKYCDSPKGKAFCLRWFENEFQFLL